MQSNNRPETFGNKMRIMQSDSRVSKLKKKTKLINYKSYSGKCLIYAPTKCKGTFLN